MPSTGKPRFRFSWITLLVVGALVWANVRTYHAESTGLGSNQVCRGWPFMAWHPMPSVTGGPILNPIALAGNLVCAAVIVAIASVLGRKSRGSAERPQA